MTKQELKKLIDYLKNIKGDLFVAINKDNAPVRAKECSDRIINKAGHAGRLLEALLEDWPGGLD